VAGHAHHAGPARSRTGGTGCTDLRADLGRLPDDVRRARLRRYVITEELVLEADGTESSRIVGKEPYPDDPEE